MSEILFSLGHSIPKAHGSSRVACLQSKALTKFTWIKLQKTVLAWATKKDIWTGTYGSVLWSNPSQQLTPSLYWDGGENQKKKSILYSNKEYEIIWINDVFFYFYINFRKYLMKNIGQGRDCKVSVSNS